MPHTYILYSDKLGKYYVGSSIDKDDRLLRHNGGAEKFTSTGIPWRIVYFEEYESILEARRRERAIKRMKSRKYIERLIANNGSSAG
jgi:putative endonuclease